MNGNCAILEGGVRLSKFSLRGLSQKSSYTIVGFLLHWLLWQLIPKMIAKDQFVFIEIKKN